MTCVLNGMTKKILRIATRKSPLALWQARFVGRLIQQHWPDIEIKLVPLVTSGDRFLTSNLQQLGGKGLFVKELEQALLANQADLAVHSMKDVPALLPESLIITAICMREDPGDALISRSKLNFAALPKQSIIGTTSLRRQSQLLAARPDLIVKSLRGNVNTRLEKLNAGEFDAIILAVAGLKRLSFESEITEQLSFSLMLPACGQGALGIECRVDNSELRYYLEPLNHPLSALCVNTERQVNALLGGNCHVPLAVYCTHDDKSLFLDARVLIPSGKQCLISSQQGLFTQATELAHQCAQQLRSQGADELLAQKE